MTSFLSVITFKLWLVTNICSLYCFPFASDTSCFQPLMSGFSERYGFYPEYPVADAGYGSFNNYLFCEEKVYKIYYVCKRNEKQKIQK